ncbi:MAG TPA: flagellar export protein FliJ [Caulobacteraceae bacterium]|jgi:flagellar export protein FliJ|nr:flagellar export protein FliJ [Caulobacteraceae bacterium]
MTWRQSLIRISNHEVETLQKRLAEIVDRGRQVEVRLALLEAEVEAEARAVGADAQASRFLADYMKGVKVRRGVLKAALDAIAAEEAGARDALSQAFESLKKFEQVAEMARLADERAAAQRETKALDEMGARAASRR